MAAPAILPRTFPLDLCGAVVSFLPLDDQAAAAAVCKSWRDGVDQETLLNAEQQRVPPQEAVRSEAVLLNRVKAYLETVQLNQCTLIECFLSNETKRRVIAAFRAPSTDTAAAPYPLAPLTCRIVGRLSEEGLREWNDERDRTDCELHLDEHIFATNTTVGDNMAPICHASGRMTRAIVRMMEVRRDTLLANAPALKLRRIFCSRTALSIGTAAAVASLAIAYQYFRN